MSRKQAVHKSVSIMCSFSMILKLKPVLTYKI